MVSKLILALLLSSGSAFAACHVVTPLGNGSKSGTDWNNAFASLPATLVRGDIYFMGTGNYGIYRFNTPESGTQVITIKKAISTDHCTDTGYYDATMGVGQAVWTNASGSGDIWLWTCCGFWVLDGQRRTSRKAGHGFKLDNSNLSIAARNPLTIAASTGSSINNITFRYVEIQGAGVNANTDYGGPLNFSEHDVNILGETSNITFEYGYIHDSSNIPVQLGGGRNGLTGSRAHDILFQYTTIARNASSGNFHGNGFYDQGGYDNITFRYGVLEDLEGTAFMGSNVAGGTTTNYAVYGNVFMRHSVPLNHTGVGLGNGTIAFYNAKTMSGIFIYNNTFVNLPPNQDGIYVGPEVTATNVQIKNNIWYNCASGTHGPNTAGMIASHNYYINTPFNASFETNVQTSLSTPLVDWVNENFHLSAPSSAGITLPTPYDIDPDGNTRGAGGLWNRGAYEFASIVPLPTPKPVGGLNGTFTCAPFPAGGWDCTLTIKPN